MDFIVLSLGSNIGDRGANLDQARHLLEMRGVEVLKSSSLYETEPYGISEQPDFLNRVLLVHANQTADELLKTCLQIETDMGRVRTEKNGPRIIDIDVLFYKDIVLEKEHLTLPHKGIATRRFVLQPLNEVAGHQIHPIFGKTIQELLAQCTDELQVKKYFEGEVG